MTPEEKIIIVIKALIIKRAKEIGYDNIPSKKYIRDEILTWLIEFDEELYNQNNI